MPYVIDLDAERREVQYPDGIEVRFNKNAFLFPAELPAAALDPLLSEDLDLVGLLTDLARTEGGSVGGDVIELLFKRPSLPRKFIDAVKAIYVICLGEEHFERFEDANPSIPDYFRITKALATVYGVELGKLFGSADSSESDGETSNPTSPDTTTSTPEASGSAPASPDSSGSAD
ncbi:hypothetical protein ACGFYQ_34250 [Streptomyces sp. NPDC048258]|uniref:hypothetical protein n=1 Tax=Streptomyces sp. NPDC048258 TaxID=3365527 RepID=UPI0037173D7E